MATQIPLTDRRSSLLDGESEPASRADELPAATPPGPERDVVQRIFLSPGRQGKQTTVLVAAVDDSAAASSLSGRLATTLASQVEGTVCVVDANLRQPTLHDQFELSGTRGLVDMFRQGIPAMEVAQSIGPNLWCIPTGSPPEDPGALFGFNQLKETIGDLRQAFKYVLLHAAPIGEFSESVLVSQWTDGVILVLEAGRTHRDSARQVRERLALVRVPLLGIVMTNCRSPIPNALSRWL